jgi:hypothetical protein
VRDLPLSRDDVIAALVAYYESAGYGVIPRQELEPDLDELLRFISGFDEGTIIERRLELLRPR